MPKAEHKPAADKNTQLPIPSTTYGSGMTSSDMFGSIEEEEEYLKVLYYGREGSGKSVNAAKLANTGRVLFVNAEGGAKLRSLKAQGVKTENIVTWPKDRQEPITAESLEELFNRIKNDLAKDVDSWHGIVFDSSTEIVQRLTGEVSDDRVRKARKRGFEIDYLDAQFTDRSDYGTMSKVFIGLVRKFRDLPVHVVFTALEREDKDEKSGDRLIGPAISASAATGLLGYVDFVIHCKAADEVNPFRGRTKQGGIIRTKDRFDILPVTFANPDMDRLIQYANEELTEKNDPDQRLIIAPKSGKKKKPADDSSESSTTEKKEE